MKKGFYKENYVFEKHFSNKFYINDLSKLIINIYFTLTKIMKKFFFIVMEIENYLYKNSNNLPFSLQDYKIKKTSR